MDQTSDSGFVTKPFVDKSTNEFTDYVEMPCGGFNRLFRAKRYGKWFVLKGLKPEYSTNPFYRELLEKEFELGMMLSHPNIVTFYGKEHDTVAGDCFVMECIDGVTLSDFLATYFPKIILCKKPKLICTQKKSDYRSFFITVSPVLAYNGNERRHNHPHHYQQLHLVTMLYHRFLLLDIPPHLRWSTGRMYLQLHNN